MKHFVGFIPDTRTVCSHREGLCDGSVSVFSDAFILCVSYSIHPVATLLGTPASCNPMQLLPGSYDACRAVFCLSCFNIVVLHRAV